MRMTWTTLGMATIIALVVGYHVGNKQAAGGSVDTPRSTMKHDRPQPNRAAPGRTIGNGIAKRSAYIFLDAADNDSRLFILSTLPSVCQHVAENGNINLHAQDAPLGPSPQSSMAIGEVLLCASDRASYWDAIRTMANSIERGDTVITNAEAHAREGALRTMTKMLAPVHRYSVAECVRKRKYRRTMEIAYKNTIAIYSRLPVLHIGNRHLQGLVTWQEWHDQLQFDDE